jgi:hypothetical protein
MSFKIHMITTGPYQRLSSHQQEENSLLLLAENCVTLQKDYESSFVPKKKMSERNF